jgi:hypothetical protein
VRQRPAAWPWRNWLPLGRLAILDGHPGLGNSTLLFDLAARVSNSGVMPDGSRGETGNVIILNAEDDPAETIQPRLAAVGANPERVFHLGEINTGQCRQTERACQNLIRRLLGSYAVPIRSVKTECQGAGFSLPSTERRAATSAWYTPETMR